MDKTPEKVAFGVARKHVIPFGKFKGQEIDKIAENCLVAYLADPTIKKELDAIT